MAVGERLAGVKRRVLRYWLPWLGGRRQCLECGFLFYRQADSQVYEVYGDTRSRLSRVLPKHPPSTPFSIPELSNSGLDTPSQQHFMQSDLKILTKEREVGCFRAVWTASGPPGSPKRQEPALTEVPKLRQCTLFFPYHQGVSPEAHLELKKEASNRWWTFWAILAATGIGGTVSGVILFLLSRGDNG